MQYSYWVNIFLPSFQMKCSKPSWQAFTPPGNCGKKVLQTILASLFTPPPFGHTFQKGASLWIKSIRSFQRLQDGMFFGLQSTTQAADRKHELDWISQAKCFCNFNNTFQRWAGALYENRTSSSINEVPGSNASDAFLLQKVEISGKPLRGRAPALFKCIFT